MQQQRFLVVVIGWYEPAKIFNINILICMQSTAGIERSHRAILFPGKILYK